MHEIIFHKGPHGDKYKVECRCDHPLQTVAAGIVVIGDFQFLG